MRIVYTVHAEARITGRQIKKEWVETAIKNPDKKMKGKFNREIVIKRINKKAIRVIYTVKDNKNVVVTAYWEIL